MPPQVILIVAAGLITLGHLLVNIINDKPYAERDEVKADSVTAPVLVAALAAQRGRVRVGALILMTALAGLMLFALSGCSLLSATIGQYEKDGGQIIVQSAERTVCKDIPIGIWLDQYGSNPTRLAGWQAICGNPIQNPLDPGTVAAILKVYPQYREAVNALMVPILQAPIAPPVVPAPVPIAPAVAVSAPVAVKARIQRK